MSYGKAPKIITLEKKMWQYEPGTTMLIPTPRLVETYLRKIPRGETRTTVQLRQDLADEHGAMFTCPIATGIFFRIVVEAAYEKMAAGVHRDQIAPFWRALEPKSPLRKRLSFDPQIADDLLAAERT